MKVWILKGEEVLWRMKKRNLWKKGEKDLQKIDCFNERARRSEKGKDKVEVSECERKIEWK